MRVIRKLLVRLARRVMRREPDFIIGGVDDPYLRRWWVVPRNRFFNIYVHQFLRDDDDRALHDHPWHSCSMLLEGSITEVLSHSGSYRRQIRRGALYWRKAQAAHRIEVNRAISPMAVTLFITGPRIREWGFHCPRGWVPWYEFVEPAQPGRIGRGCE